MDYFKIICHRIPKRCYKIDDKVIPLCSRCFGFYIFTTIGILSSYLFNIAVLFRKTTMLILIIISPLPLIIDGTTQLFKYRESNNHLRFTTGSIAGFVCGLGAHFIIIQ